MAEIFKFVGTGLCVLAVIALVFASMKKGGRSKNG